MHVLLLVQPPAFAGPRGIPLIGTFSVVAEPARHATATVPPCRADEAAAQVKIANDLKATEVFGTRDRD
jgi:hypothetical protein